MCGRFVSSSTPEEIADHFDARLPPEVSTTPSWNVAPTDDIAIVRADGDRPCVAIHHWGLVPFWAKGPAIGSKMINARAETVRTKGAYKAAFARRRCIVPVDAFYEWQAVPGQRTKVPHVIERVDGAPLALAGLWEEWRDPEDPDGARLRSATIVTTRPNELMATIHDRMPVVLAPEAWSRWLDPEEQDLDEIEELLVPAPDDLLTLRQVSTAVNAVRNDGPHLLDPVAVSEPEPSLFDLGSASTS